VVVIVLAVGVRTGLVRPHSTAGFPVVPATRRAVLDLDGVVLGHQAEFLEQRQIAAAEVSEVVTWIWSGHGPTVARHHRRPLALVVGLEILLADRSAWRGALSFPATLMAWGVLQPAVFGFS
jgi:hypothetical protein